MSATTKIAVYSLADLKNTTDDALPNYLKSLRFQQSNYYTDVRLALGYTAVTIAGVLFYFDWSLGWDATKAYTAPAVLVYFILNGAFTYWIWGVERGVVFAGSRNGVRISIASKTEKHVPEYNLTVQYTDEKKSASREAKIKAPFTRWFTADGYFVAKPFQQWLASEIPVIGAADPANVVEDIGRGSETEKVVYQGVTSANVAQVLDELKQTGKKAGARNRRKG